jgi:hypothetical protein
MALRISTGARTAILDSGLGPLFDTDGALAIFSGTIPANADADIGAGTLLATLTLSADWLGAAAAGVATLAAIASDTAVDATGTAAWFRLHDASEGPTGSSATKRRIDGTVGTSGADLIFDTTAFVVGGAAAVSSFTLTLPAS